MDRCKSCEKLKRALMSEIDSGDEEEQIIEELEELIIEEIKEDELKKIRNITTWNKMTVRLLEKLSTTEEMRSSSLKGMICTANSNHQSNAKKKFDSKKRNAVLLFVKMKFPDVKFSHIRKVIKNKLNSESKKILPNNAGRDEDENGDGDGLEQIGESGKREIRAKRGPTYESKNEADNSEQKGGNRKRATRSKRDPTDESKNEANNSEQKSGKRKIATRSKRDPTDESKNEADNSEGKGRKRKRANRAKIH